MPRVFLQDSLLLFPETGVHPPILVKKEGAGAAIVRVSIIATSVASAANSLERAIKSARDPSSDFYATNQVLEWGEDDEGTQEIEIVDIKQDAIVEQPEMFYVRIRNGTSDPMNLGLDTCYCFILDGDGSSFFQRYVMGTPSPAPSPTPAPTPTPTPAPTPTPGVLLDKTNWSIQPEILQNGTTLVNTSGLEQIFDGDENTYWESPALSGHQVSLTLDLMGLYEVEKIVIKSGDSPHRAFGGFLLSEGGNYTGIGYSDYLDGEIHIGEPARSIMLRAAIAGNSGNQEWHLYEIDVYGSPIPENFFNITAAPISKNDWSVLPTVLNTRGMGYVSTQPTEPLYDQDPATYWESPLLDRSDITLVVDLGKIVDVGVIRFKSGDIPNRAYGGIMVTTQTPHMTGTTYRGIGWQGYLHGDIEVNREVRAIMVRVASANNLQNQEWHLHEIDVFERSATAAPAPAPSPTPAPLPVPVPAPAPAPRYQSEELPGYSLLAYPKHVEWGEKVFVRWETPTGVPQRRSAIVMLKEGDKNNEFNIRLQRPTIFSGITQQHAPNSEENYHFKYMPAGADGNYNSVATSNSIKVWTPGSSLPDLIKALNPILYADTQEKNLYIPADPGYKIQQVKSYIGQGLTQNVLEGAPIRSAYYGTEIAEFDGQIEYFELGPISFASEASISFLVNVANNWNGSLFSTNTFTLNLEVNPQTGDTQLKYVDNTQSHFLGLVPTDTLMSPSAAQWSVVTVNITPTKITYFLNGESRGSANGVFVSSGITESELGHQTSPFPEAQEKGYFKGQLMAVAFFDRVTSLEERNTILEHWREKFGLSLI
ncbi:MAG: hypothetical protein J7525_19700 [Roseofilum sp. SID3]|uniref:LamG-like jellyroll fold domain-containing protein n=1 Tax=Roseofilum sp. SID3 TaxID=2821499 RepID=UPI001B2831A0|nr:LamG-like jellyroll fold domain-containing protein [Roseofilum sp. SID3]MBP0015321.1 hypothetical protein [Roseofilum sp. SID3]